MRIVAYLAASLDGFIAGVGGDLSWLPQDVDLAEFGFEPFLDTCGAVLLGRRTFDVVRSFGGPWPYRDLPLLVASHRPLPSRPPGRVRRVEGSIAAMLAEASQEAAGRTVYVDGGEVVRDALRAGLLDRLILTQVPIALGAGVPLFGPSAPSRFERESVVALPQGLVQWQLRPRT